MRINRAQAFKRVDHQGGWIIQKVFVCVEYLDAPIVLWGIISLWPAIMWWRRGEEESDNGHTGHRAHTRPALVFLSSTYLQFHDLPPPRYANSTHTSRVTLVRTKR